MPPLGRTLVGFGLVNDWVSVENTGIVARNLGLRKDVAAFEAAAACASFLHQLRIASRLVESGEFRTVLIYVSSAASLVIDYAAPSSVVPGDGAVAAVIRRVDDGLGYVASATSTHGEYHDGILIVPRDDSRSPWWRADAGPILMKRVDSGAAHHMGAHAASTCRETFSTTTMPSSTTVPMARTSASRVRRLIE